MGCMEQPYLDIPETKPSSVDDNGITFSYEVPS